MTWSRSGTLPHSCYLREITRRRDPFGSMKERVFRCLEVDALFRDEGLIQMRSKSSARGLPLVEQIMELVEQLLQALGPQRYFRTLKVYRKFHAAGHCVFLSAGCKQRSNTADHQRRLRIPLVVDNRLKTLGKTLVRGRATQLAERDLLKIFKPEVWPTL